MSEIPVIPERIAGLWDLATDLWWVWHREAREVFRRLDYKVWRLTAHNPVRMLRLVTPERFATMAADPSFLALFDEAMAHNAKCDAARRRYVTTYFNTDVANPAAYDLVINTAHVPLAEAADMITAHLRALTPVAA